MTFYTKKNTSKLPFFFFISELETYEQRVSEIARLVSQLPEPHKRMLEILCSHLEKVASKSNKNMMTVANLGVCFGPTLLRDEEETVAAIMDIKFANVVVEILIENWRQILLGKYKKIFFFGLFFSIFSLFSTGEPPNYKNHQQLTVLPISPSQMTSTPPKNYGISPRMVSPRPPPPYPHPPPPPAASSVIYHNHNGSKMVSMIKLQNRGSKISPKKPF